MLVQMIWRIMATAPLVTNAPPEETKKPGRVAWDPPACTLALANEFPPAGGLKPLREDPEADRQQTGVAI